MQNFGYKKELHERMRDHVSLSDKQKRNQR